jgi:hypothetical protein
MLIISSPTPPSVLITIVFPGCTIPSQYFNLSPFSKRGFSGLSCVRKLIIPSAKLPSRICLVNIRCSSDLACFLSSGTSFDMMSSASSFLFIKERFAA